MDNEFCLKMPDFHVTFRDLLHAVNLRNGTDGFTSLPKEGLLRIFSHWKIQRLRSCLNPRTWVPKASTLPLDYWSRLLVVSCRRFGTTYISYLQRLHCLTHEVGPIGYCRNLTNQISFTQRRNHEIASAALIPCWGYGHSPVASFACLGDHLQ